MSLTEWRKERIEQAMRSGEVIKITGPRSLADPGHCCSEPAGSLACIDCPGSKGGPMEPLAPEGESLANAREALADATAACKAAVLRDLAAGLSESKAALRYGVTRMTIRAWRAADTEEGNP